MKIIHDIYITDKTDANIDLMINCKKYFATGTATKTNLISWILFYTGDNTAHISRESRNCLPRSHAKKWKRWRVYNMYRDLTCM